MSIDIQQLSELERKATPGPWYPKPATYGWDVWGNLDDGTDGWIGPVKRVISPHSSIHSAQDICRDSDETEANAALIVAMRNALPALLASLASKDAEIERLKTLTETLKMQASCHAMEARGANATIHESYQAVTGATGEPGNWNGARPIKDALVTERARTELEAGHE